MISSLLHLVGLRPRVYYTLTNFRGGGQGPLGPPLNTPMIGYNADPYGQSFFPKCISAWNGLAQEIAEANTLDLFKSKLAH